MFGETNRCDDDNENDGGGDGCNQIIMRPADRIIAKSVACSICTPLLVMLAIIIYHVILYCSI